MRILLADSQSKVRFALRVLLQQQPDTRIVADVSDAQTLLAESEAKEPDILLLEWELPGLRDVGGIAGLRRLSPKAKVIALSGRPGTRCPALEGGADAFVSKSDPPERLLDAIRDCLAEADEREGSE